MSSDGEEEVATTPPDESTLRESVTTIAAAQLVRNRKSAKSPVSPVAVPLQQTEIIPVMASPPRPVRVLSPPPCPAARSTASSPPCPKQDPPLPAARSDRAEIANMEVEVAVALEKEEPPIAAPKRSWSSIVSVSAKHKSQKTKKNFPAEAEPEKSAEEEKKGKKKGKNGKKEPEKRRESPKKEEPEALWEEPQEEEYIRVAEPEECLPVVEDVLEVVEDVVADPVPLEEELPDSEEDLSVLALPQLVEEEEIQHLLLADEELQVEEHEQSMRDYLLRIASSEHESEEESAQLVLDDLEEDQHYLPRYEVLALSTIEDTEYVEAENEVPYYCISDRERVIDELEECESFYHDAHKVVQEPLEEKPLEAEKPDKEVNVEEEPVDVVECCPVVETLATASADTSKRNRRQKKKRR